jgi:hypothetical protein
MLKRDWEASYKKWGDLGNENKFVIFKLEMPTSRYFIIKQFQCAGTQQSTQNIISKDYRYFSDSKVV